MKLRSLLFASLTCIPPLSVSASLGSMPHPGAKLVTAPPSAERAPASYGVWHSCEIGGGGFVQAVVPTSDPNIYYTYVDVGGVYRSDDAGRSWRMLHAGLPAGDGGAYSVRSLTVNPGNPNDVCVAAGTQWAAQGGIFRSRDGGVTWKKTLSAWFYGNENYHWTGPLFARTSQKPAEIFAASGGDGIFVSTDGGDSWRRAALPGYFFTDIHASPANSRTLWACAQPQKLWRAGTNVSLSGGFFASSDAGAHWKQLGQNAPEEMVSRGSLLYGVFQGREIRSSRDSGLTWQDCSQGLPVADKAPGSISESGFNALTAGPDFLLTASTRGTFYRLNAGGEVWRRVAQDGVTENYEGRPWFGAMAPGKWQHFGASLSHVTVDPRDPAHWYFTDWYSIYQSRDAGAHWSLSMDGVECAVVHTLTADPADVGLVHLGMADNGYFNSEDGGVRFSQRGSMSNCKLVAVSPAMPSWIYATGDRGDGQWRADQVWVSKDRGQSWSASPMTGLPDMGTASCNSLAVAPDDPLTVYVSLSGPINPGGGGVYVSHDGALTWEWLGQGLPSGQGVFSSDIWGIGRELAALPHGVVLALSRDGKSVYRFDGQTWNRVKEFANQPHCIASDLEGRCFVAVPDDGIYRSVDAGLTWTEVWHGDAGHVAVASADSSRVAAGVADGVLLSLDGGDSWKLLSTTLPYRAKPVVALSRDRLYAGTSGSGAFWTPISEAGAGLLAARPLEIVTEANADEVPTSLIANGSMSEGTQVPDGWNLWVGAGQPTLNRDNQVFHAAPASLRVDAPDGAYGSASTPITITGKPFTMTGYFKTTATVGEADIAIQVLDAKNKQIGWIPLGSGPSTDWKHFEQQVTLPPNAWIASLTVAIKGKGSIWVDEVSATSADAATPATSPAVAIPNGSMSDGTAVPAGWSQDWTGSGTLRLGRDTADFSSAPASLRLESVGGPAEGSANLRITGQGAFTISGAVKASAGLKQAQIAIQCLDASGKQVGWINLTDAKDAAQWTTFTATGKIPATAAICQIVVVLSGDGKIWLDDLRSG